MASKKSQQQTADTKEAPKKSTVAAIRKVSIATVYGKVRIADIPQDGELHLCRMAGVASSVESGESTYGDWQCLVGEFAAVNQQTGEMYAGNKCFVPSAMGEMLVSQMSGALLEDAAARLKFSVDIFAKVSARDENKYEYVIRPVLAPEVKNEAMALLEWAGE